MTVNKSFVVFEKTSEPDSELKRRDYEEFMLHVESDSSRNQNETALVRQWARKAMVGDVLETSHEEIVVCCRKVDRIDCEHQTTVRYFIEKEE